VSSPEYRLLRKIGNYCELFSIAVTYRLNREPLVVVKTIQFAEISERARTVTVREDTIDSMGLLYIA
jgi:hypothetical protein